VAVSAQAGHLLSRLTASPSRVRAAELPPVSHVPHELSSLTAVEPCWMNQAVLRTASYLPLFVLCFYLNKNLKCPDMKENILPGLRGILSSFFFLGGTN